MNFRTGINGILSLLSTTILIVISHHAFAQCENSGAATVVDFYKTPDPGVVTNRDTGDPLSIERGVQLRDSITLKVICLESYLDGDKSSANRNLVLYINGRPLGDLPVVAIADHPKEPDTKLVQFDLRRTEKSRDVWTALLGYPLSDGGKRKLAVTIGLENKPPLPVATNVDLLTLNVVPVGPFAFWLVVFAALLYVFVSMARKSDLLRDPGTVSVGERRTFSLARVQAAWWTFLILASYLLVGIVTGDFATSVTGTSAILLGLAAATTAGAAAIDSTRLGEIEKAKAKLAEAETADPAPDAAKLQSELETAKQALDSSVRATPPNEAEIAQRRQAVNDAEARLAAALARLAVIVDLKKQLKELQPASEGFLKDILSDSSGVAFHRFQVLAWAVVLGIVFVWAVYKNLAMPQWDDSLLALLGISSGTYLGLKLPEQPASKPSTN